MSQTGSNHKTNRIESWFEFGRNLGRAGSNHDSNRVEFCVEQGRVLSQTGSNHETNRVELPFERGQNQTRSNHESKGSNRGSNLAKTWVKFWVEDDQIMRRTRSIESKRVESEVKQGRIMNRTASNYESNRVKSWFEIGRRNLGRAGSNNESIAVKFWVKRAQIMRRSGSIESERGETLVKQGRVAK